MDPLEQHSKVSDISAARRRVQTGFADLVADIRFLSVEAKSRCDGEKLMNVSDEMKRLRNALKEFIDV